MRIHLPRTINKTGKRRQSLIAYQDHQQMLFTSSINGTRRHSVCFCAGRIHGGFIFRKEICVWNCWKSITICLLLVIKDATVLILACAAMCIGREWAWMCKDMFVLAISAKEWKGDVVTMVCSSPCRFLTALGRTSAWIWSLVFLWQTMVLMPFLPLSIVWARVFTCVLRLRQSMQRVQQTSTFRTCSDSMAYLAPLSVIETRASRLSFWRRFFPDWVASSSSAQLTTSKQTGKVKERIELLVTFCDLSSTIGRTIGTTVFRSVWVCHQWYATGIDQGDSFQDRLWLAFHQSSGYVKFATRFGCSAMAGVSTGSISNRTWLHSGSSSSPSIVCGSTSTWRRFPHGGESVGPQTDFLSTDVTRAQPCEKLKPVWSAPSRLLKCCLLTPPGWNFLGIAEHTQFLMFLPWGNITPTTFLVEYSLRHRLWLTWTVINDIQYVEKVLDCRERHGKTQYLVKWIWYCEPTWEPEAYLCDEEGGHLLPLQEFLQQQRAMFQWWFLLGNHNHQANPHVHQQHIVLATTFWSGLPQPLSSQMARRERKPTKI